MFDSKVNLAEYNFIDLILGEEKETHWIRPYADSLWGTRFKTFPNRFQEQIKKYLEAGGNLFVSGAYIGSDLYLNKDSTDIKFAEEVLHYKLDSDHAVKSGAVISARNIPFFNNVSVTFNTKFNEKLYKVEAPDAIGSVNGSETLLRYYENFYSAGVGYKKEYGVIAFGFPFESIIDSSERTKLMKLVTEYLQIERN